MDMGVWHAAPSRSRRPENLNDDLALNLDRVPDRPAETTVLPPNCAWEDTRARVRDAREEEPSRDGADDTP